MRLRQFLNRPLLGTVAIPPCSCVDPSRFPEEEFPVSCPKCTYSLRGLPDGRCPECGEPFDRGRLLVVEYAEGTTQISLRDRRYRGILWLAVAIGLLLPALHFALYLFLIASGGSSSPVAALLWASRILAGIHVLLLGVLLFQILRVFRVLHRKKEQRRRILSALGQ